MALLLLCPFTVPHFELVILPPAARFDVCVIYIFFPFLLFPPRVRSGFSKPNIPILVFNFQQVGLSTVPVSSPPF